MDILHTGITQIKFYQRIDLALPIRPPRDKGKRDKKSGLK